jgi:integrase/recombinase XerD
MGDCLAQMSLLTESSKQMNELIPYALPDIRDILAGQLTRSSIAMYRRDVRAYATFADSRGLPQFDHQTLIAWRDELASNTTLSPHTINRMMSAVRRTVKEAAGRSIVMAPVSHAFNNVAGVSVRALKERLKMDSRTRITPEDMRRLCEAPGGSLIGQRDRALLATLASSGLRASELATLQYRQIERRGAGYILRVQGKSDIEYRDAHVSTEAKGLIDAWVAARPMESPFIFTSFSTRGAIPYPDPLSTTAVWLIVQKYARMCNLTHIKAHDFRRFVGTQMAKDDLRKAQKALGHKRIDTTARHYILDELEPGATDHLY